MILFLTYHKVCAGRGEEAEFYTVSRPVLARQLRAVAAAGLQPLGPADLTKARPAADRRFMLSFDDGTKDHAETVMPLLNSLNLRAVFFVPTAQLNQPGYLSSAQLKELAAAGHTIGCHSHEHKRMDVLSKDEIQHQFEQSRSILRDATGVEPWIFAPPGGFINAAVRAAALHSGLRHIRTMRWGFNRQPDLAALETVPINRHTSDRQFQNILEGRQSRLVYFGKQAVKTLVPARAYERLRSWICKSGRKN